jgi:hypothetical protein
MAGVAANAKTQAAAITDFFMIFLPYLFLIRCKDRARIRFGESPGVMVENRSGVDLDGP